MGPERTIEEQLAIQHAYNATRIQIPRADLDAAIEAMERVLPYTDAERLAEESAIRLGLDRAPIRLALRRANEALASLKGHRDAS